jgi:hypothetical protein
LTPYVDKIVYLEAGAVGVAVIDRDVIDSRQPASCIAALKATLALTLALRW